MKTRKLAAAWGLACYIAAVHFSTASIASPKDSDASKVLQPSTVAIVKVDQAALAEPAGLLTAEELQPLIQVMQILSAGDDAWLTFELTPSIFTPSVRLYGVADDTSIDELNKSLDGTGYGPAIESGDLRVIELTKWAKSSSQQHTVDTQRAEMLAAAMATVEDSAISCVVLPPQAIWRAYEETFTSLPPEFGGGPITTLTRGMQWAGIKIDPVKTTVHAHIQSESASDAKALAEIWPKLLNGLIAAIPLKRADTLKDSLRSVSDATKTTVGSSAVQVTLDASNLTGLAGDSVKTLLGQTAAPLLARRKQEQLRTMMLAIHNHESAYRSFPPSKKARKLEGGKSGLSWRVHVLPFMGKEAQALWSEFNLEESWDSEHNKKLLSRMPDVYGLPNGLLGSTAIKSGYTTWLAPEGEKCWMGQPKAFSFGKVTDGTSNTIAIVRVKPELAVPWTAPQDYRFAPESPADGLATDASGSVDAAMLDGSSHRLPVDLEPETWKHLFEMNDGHVVNPHRE